MPPMCYPRLELLCAEVAVCPLCVTSASAHEQRNRSEMICLSKRGWVLAAAPRRHGAHLAVRRETSAVAKTVWWPMASRLAPTGPVGSYASPWGSNLGSRQRLKPGSDRPKPIGGLS